MRMLLALAALSLVAAAPSSSLVLRGDGLSRTVSGKTQILRFGMPRAAATAAVTAVLGKPKTTHTVPDCGQGDPMTLVEYKGGLTVQFLKGRFSGWSLDDPGMKTASGIALGSSRAAVMKAYPDMDIDDGSLGVMFMREGGPSGFFDSSKPGAHVIGLFSGETCMVS